MLGPHADLAARRETSPMAYLRQIIARIEVLGRDAARAEPTELEARAKSAR